MEDYQSHPTVFEPVSEPYFREIWRTKFPNIKLRKHIRFSKCSTCESLRKIRWSRQSTIQQRQKSQIDLIQHYADVKAERAYAASKRQLSMVHRTEVLSIALDGTDQLPRGLPQFRVTTSHDATSHERIKSKFTLLRIHNLEKTFCFEHLHNIKGDANLTIECLQRALKYTESVMGRLPDELQIQVDNCSRENKNSIVLNWFATLAERGLFPNGIFLNFLPVGHTHNDADQQFVPLTYELRKSVIKSLSDYVAAIKTAYKDPPKAVRHVQAIHDFTKWLKVDFGEKFAGFARRTITYRNDPVGLKGFKVIPRLAYQTSGFIAALG